MRDHLQLRREPRCPWGDFWHRIRVGFVIFVLIVVVQLVTRCF